MTVLERFISMQLPLFRLHAELAALPSPRMRFAQRVQSISGLSFNSVMAILTGSKHYASPGIDVQKKIAEAFNSSIKDLFPSEKGRGGSLAYRYTLESRKQEELNQFVKLLSAVTHRSERTVKQWMKIGRIPHSVNRHNIAVALGVPIQTLFPSD